MNGYGQMTGGANAFMQFMQGVQEGRQIREQKQRQQDFYQMLQSQMQQGQVRPKAAMSSEGGMSYSFPFVEEPHQIQSGVDVPEGYEITGYDPKTGQPKKVEKKKIVEEKVAKPAKKITGMIRKLKAANASRKDIEEAIRFEGYEVEDYSKELEEYQSFTGRGASGRW